VEDEQDDEDRRPDQLGDHPDVVDRRHHLDAQHVDESGEDDKDRAEDERVLGPLGVL